MVTKEYIAILFSILNISHQVYAQYSIMYKENNIDEGISCEVITQVALEEFKTEINNKLDGIDTALFNKLEIYLDKQLSVIEKNNKATREGTDEKLQNMERTIIYKLEDYVNEKINSLEKHVYRKIDGLVSISANKTDTSIINHKLDALKKMQLESDRRAVIALVNETWLQIEENLNKHLNMKLKIVLDENNKTIDLRIDTLNKNLANFEQNINQKWTELSSMMLKLENNIGRIPDAWSQKTSDKFDETLTEMGKNISENVKNELDGLNKNYGKNIDKKLNEIQKEIPILEQNLNKGTDVLQNLEKKILSRVETSQYLGCKEYHALGNGYVDYFHMDAKSLNHVVYRKESNGKVLYFEMHLAIKGNSVNIMIAPSVEASAKGHKKYFELGIYTAYINWFHLGKRIGHRAVPDMMNTERFTPIYIKMYNDTLEVGKEGGPPLLTYSHEELKHSGRFSFGTVSRDLIPTILYDCPLIVF